MLNMHIAGGCGYYRHGWFMLLLVGLILDQLMIQFQCGWMKYSVSVLRDQFLTVCTITGLHIIVPTLIMLEWLVQVSVSVCVYTV